MTHMTYWVYEDDPTDRVRVHGQFVIGRAGDRITQYYVAARALALPLAAAHAPSLPCRRWLSQ